MYVNAKQYHRILKRREARAALEQATQQARARKVRHTLGGGVVPRTRHGAC
jgi:hypothetical protein